MIILGFYVGIRFGSWFGSDWQADAENAFMTLENLIIQAFKFVYDWIASLFNKS